MKRPLTTVLLASLILFAGCGADPVGSTESTVSEPPSSETTKSNEGQAFKADFTRSVSPCGLTCKQVNFSVDLTYTGEKQELLYPTVEMSVYALDEGLTGWGEPKRKEIWWDSEYVDNISAGETVSFDRSFQIGSGEGVTILLSDCVVYGSIAVDYSEETWNKTEKFRVQASQCNN